MITWFLTNIWIFQALGIIVSILCLVASVRLMIKMDYFGGIKKYGVSLFKKYPSTNEVMASLWEKVLKRTTSRVPQEWGQAVLLADKIFDESLRVIGSKGKTVEERIQSADIQATGSLDEIKKIRANILHILQQEQKTITLDQAKETLRAYRDVLQRMGML